MGQDVFRALAAANRETALYRCVDGPFARYGRVLEGYDISEYARRAGEEEGPMEGVFYTPSAPFLEEAPVTGRIRREIFGEMAVQAGWCRGHNLQVGALEYHKSQEVVAAVTDLVLFCGNAGDIRDMRYDARLLEGFFCAAGSVVELHPLTLHFAPVQCGPGGFCAVIILPAGTNVPLDGPPAGDSTGEGRLLFMKNKWLVASPGSPQEGRGAYAGIDNTLPPLKLP